MLTVVTGDASNKISDKKVKTNALGIFCVDSIPDPVRHPNWQDYKTLVIYKHMECDGVRKKYYVICTVILYRHGLYVCMCVCVCVCVRVCV